MTRNDEPTSTPRISDTCSDCHGKDRHAPGCPELQREIESETHTFCYVCERHWPQDQAAECLVGCGECEDCEPELYCTDCIQKHLSEAHGPDPREALIDELASVLATTLAPLDYPKDDPAAVKRITDQARAALARATAHQEARRVHN